MEVELAILFIDVCDSTRLYEAAGNIRATEIIQGTLKRLEVVVVQAGGRVVKSLGDGLMCVFPDPAPAAAAAEAMVMIPASRGGAIHLRFGLHFGSAVDSGGDVFGDAINVAARVQSLASPDEILVTDQMVRRLPDAVRQRAVLVETTTVKGKSVPIGLFRLRHHDTVDDSIESTMIGFDGSFAGGEASLALKLRYRNREFVVDLHRPKRTIGRNEICDIVILSRQTSRQHGAVEFSRESFMLTDHSSNGTFIRTGDGPPIVVRRDSTRLVGTGLLGIGAAPNHPSEDHVISFVCDLRG